MKKELVAHRDPKSPISEVFRTLRTNIQFMNTTKKMQTLLVTSTYPGEGKSWVSSNLAVIFAQTGKRVILVDADMRKGRQYTIFGASPKPGLSNCLSKMCQMEDEEINLSEFIQETKIENLYLVAAGNVPPNPSELLVSPQMVKLLEDLKQVFDIVIIDGTPSAIVTDAVVLSRIVDSTIIVTAHKETKKDDLEHVIKGIQNVGGKIAGIVLNKVPMSSKRYEERYYYGSDFFGGPQKVKKSEVLKSNRPSITHNKENTYKKETRQEQINQEKIKKTMQDNSDVKDIKEQVEKPKTFENLQNVEIESNNHISIERTNDILKQINDYLDQEKKKLE